MILTVDVYLENVHVFQNCSSIKEKLGDLLKKHKEQRYDAVRVVKDLSESVSETK